VNEYERTPEQWRELSARFRERHSFEDDQEESESSREESREESFGDVVARLRSGRQETAPVDPAIEAARRKVARMERASSTVAKLTALSKKAGKGDQEAKERVIAILDGDPELCSEMADVSRSAEGLLLDAISGGVFAYRAALARRADTMRQEQLAKHPLLLERTAVENVLLSWWQLQLVDSRFALAAQRGGRTDGWTKLQERAMKRYQSALKSLALAAKVNQALNRANSTTATTQSATASKTAPVGKVRTRSKPAKRKTAATVAATSAVDCSEQQQCETPRRPASGSIPTSRRPAANRVGQFVGTNGAPVSSNGHATG
jgi:hypothetical protein